MKLPILIFLTVWTISDAYRILGVFPRNAPGHFLVFEQLMKSLADRGHHVDVVSSFPQATTYPNYYDVVELPPSASFNKLTYEQINTKVKSVLDLINTQYGNDVCHVLGNPKLQKILRNPPKEDPYDVVVTEVFIANCFIAIGNVLNVPVVGMSTYGRQPWIYDMVSNPDGFDLVPGVSVDMYVSLDTSFLHRLAKVLSNFYQKKSFYDLTKPQNDILKQHLGKKASGIRELESSVALVLTNAHRTTHGVRPLTPALVEVGGMHIVEKHSPPLYYDINEWLDKNKNGVVYFNLGSNFEIESLPNEKITAIYQSLLNLIPMNVLMRYSNFDALPIGLPDNVLVVPHVQQLKVLQHPNVRAFITQGGLLGIQEAIYAGVPVVGIPLWDDQFENVDLCVHKNIGVKVELENLTKNTLDAAFHQVVKNATYRRSAKEFSKLVYDRPTAPIDTASYWIEYVAKYGNNILKPNGNVTWWQLNNIDVYGALFIFALALIVIVTVIIRKVITKFTSRINRKPKSQKLL